MTARRAVALAAAALVLLGGTYAATELLAPSLVPAAVGIAALLLIGLLTAALCLDRPSPNGDH